MISVTGGFNQQYNAGEPKVHKLKYATDTLALSDAIVAGLTIQHFRFFPTDSLVLTDEISAELTIQHFNNPVADTLTLTDAVETSLAEA